MMMMMMMMMMMVTCNLREIAALARLCLWINPALVQLHCGFLLLPVLLLLTGELLEVTLTHFFEDGADFDHGLLRVIHTHTRTHTHTRARAPAACCPRFPAAAALPTAASSAAAAAAQGRRCSPRPARCCPSLGRAWLACGARAGRAQIG